jgi:hypothetical protein
VIRRSRIAGSGDLKTGSQKELRATLFSITKLPNCGVQITGSPDRPMDRWTDYRIARWTGVGITPML